MVLTTLCTYALQGLTVPQKQELATLIDCSMKSIYRWIAENKNNGPLTTKAAIGFMQRVFGAPEDLLVTERYEATNILEVPWEDNPSHSPLDLID